MQQNEPTKKLNIELFPQELLNLHREIQKHPLLLRLLHEQSNKDPYVQILEIATYCEVLVAGTYTHQDMLNLCELLTKKLYSKRSIIVL